MNYYDNNGLIVQRDGDGGDTAGREGDYFFHLGLIGYKFTDFDRVLALLQVSPGVFVRNPTHYNDPNDFSRDQTVPLILAMGQMGRTKVLKLLLNKQIKNYFRYQNNDIGAFSDVGYYIRAFKAWYLYPILFVTDLQLIVESIVRCIQGKDPTNTSDDINHTLALLQAQYRLPTVGSWLARKIYVLFRPGGIQAAWDRYFDPNSGANPFNELYKNLISSM